MGSKVYQVDDYEVALHLQSDTLTVRTRKVPDIFLGGEDCLNVLVSRAPRPSYVEQLPSVRQYVDAMRETLVERERSAVFGLEHFLRARGYVEFGRGLDYAEPFPLASGDRVLLLEGSRCVSVRFGDDEVDLLATPVVVTNYWMNLMPDERWAYLAVDEPRAPEPDDPLRFPARLRRFAKVQLGSLVLVPVSGHVSKGTRDR